MRFKICQTLSVKNDLIIILFGNTKTNIYSVVMG